MKHARVFAFAFALLCLTIQPALAINMCTEANTVEVRAPDHYICGNGICETGEVCDDGENNNDYDPDKCRPDCRLYGCGDGVTDTGEECDDYLSYGEQNRPNVCRNDCTLPRCGDGIVDDAAPYNEECDDGNAVNDDGCSTACKLPVQKQGGVIPDAVKPEYKQRILRTAPKAKKPETPAATTPYQMQTKPYLRRDGK